MGTETDLGGKRISLYFDRFGLKWQREVWGKGSWWRERSEKLKIEL